jgi:hypothetical protein
VVETVPPAIAPFGELKWLFNLTITGIPAAVKSAFSGSSCQPIIRRFNVFVVAIVLTAKAAEDIPVVVEPDVPDEKLALAKT